MNNGAKCPKEWGWDLKLGLVLALVTVLVGLVFGPRDACGQEMASQEPPSVSGSVEFWSQYLQLTGGIAHDQPVLQGNVTSQFKNGVYVDVWASYAEGPWPSTYGHEADISFGYAPNDNVDVGVSYIVASRLTSSDLGWVYMQFTTPSHEELGWSVSAFVRTDYYWPLESGGLPPGYNFHVGGTLSKEFGKWTASQGVTVLYDTGAFGAGEGLVWIASAEVARKVGALTVGVGVKYSRGINLPEWDDRTGEFVLGTFLRF